MDHDDPRWALLTEWLNDHACGPRQKNGGRRPQIVPEVKVSRMSYQPEQAAEEILMTTWSPDGETIPFPVDPGAIAEKLGIKVFAAGLEDNVSGMLVKRLAMDPKIYINGSDSKSRQRFTCAHELGHYVKRTSTTAPATVDNWEFIDYRNPLSGTGLDPEEIWRTSSLPQC